MEKLPLRIYEFFAMKSMLNLLDKTNKNGKFVDIFKYLLTDWHWKNKMEGIAIVEVIRVMRQHGYTSVGEALRGQEKKIVF